MTRPGVGESAPPPTVPTRWRHNQTAWWGRPCPALFVVATLVLMCTAVQAVRDRRFLVDTTGPAILYIDSGEVLQRFALSFDTVWADIYWIRAIQHYGAMKLVDEASSDYSLLFPLLDITTTLDPQFNAVYRLGAIFLTEAYPNGPGRPDLAVALLQKGVAANPDRWEYLQDIGFVYYWSLHDYREAARWFQLASEVPGAPWWLRALAATTLSEGGNRAGSRLLWQQLYRSADSDWMRQEASRRLAQLDALAQIELYERAVAVFRERRGRGPRTWPELIADSGLTTVPRDPTGAEFVLDPRTNEVTVSEQSLLFPLPDEPRPPPAESR